MEVRTSNKPFLDATHAYLERLGQDIRPLLVTNGGPILMSQVENEYGSYDSDHDYIRALRDMMRVAFPGIPLYTNDGGTKSMLEGGQIHGALAITDGDPQTGFAARDKYVTDPTSLGPHMCGEYSVTWLDHWSSTAAHQTISGKPAEIDSVLYDLKWILNNNGSFAIYMFHGGTNWGFQNGANWDGKLGATTTSYDYGAPLDESGRTTDTYMAIRKALEPWQGPDGLPPLVPEAPVIEVPSFLVKPAWPCSIRSPIR